MCLQDSNIVESLGDQVNLLESQLQKSRDEIQQLKTQVKSRDREINRLHSETMDGSSSGRKNLDQINKTNSMIVKQLNGQIDFLSEQLAEMGKKRLLHRDYLCVCTLQ